jgi:TPR repeat protein
MKNAFAVWGVLRVRSRNDNENADVMLFFFEDGQSRAGHCHDRRADAAATKHSAEGGFAPAQTSVGVAYETGSGCRRTRRQDEREAARLFLAAGRGGLDKDVSRAARLYWVRSDGQCVDHGIRWIERTVTGRVVARHRNPRQCVC